ncbi:hypothetical protein K432DRAFT_77039 [Lepidopterella palustris CBS 459.81]|uniref:Uncharacterized protein n=1 Tax=Lepidopterella palustris CBS 459.81 TaxID=1314670 RepID=A0A8E2EJ63_9PEZI|nr:hypothetical protein K432DRAFT_77039 [Lepidopterella palustris CBS 459.81]
MLSFPFGRDASTSTTMPPPNTPPIENHTIKVPLAEITPAERSITEDPPTKTPLPEVPTPENTPLETTAPKPTSAPETPKTSPDARLRTFLAAILMFYMGFTYLNAGLQVFQRSNLCKSPSTPPIIPLAIRDPGRTVPEEPRVMIPPSDHAWSYTWPDGSPASPSDARFWKDMPSGGPPGVTAKQWIVDILERNKYIPLRQWDIRTFLECIHTKVVKAKQNKLDREATPPSSPPPPPPLEPPRVRPLRALAIDVKTLVLETQAKLIDATKEVSLCVRAGFLVVMKQAMTAIIDVAPAVINFILSILQNTILLCWLTLILRHHARNPANRLNFSPSKFVDLKSDSEFWYRNILTLVMKAVLYNDYLLHFLEGPGLYLALVWYTMMTAYGIFGLFWPSYPTVLQDVYDFTGLCSTGIQDLWAQLSEPEGPARAAKQAGDIVAAITSSIVTDILGFVYTIRMAINKLVDEAAGVVRDVMRATRSTLTPAEPEQPKITLDERTYEEKFIAVCKKVAKQISDETGISYNLADFINDHSDPSVYTDSDGDGLPEDLPTSSPYRAFERSRLDGTFVGHPAAGLFMGSWDDSESESVDGEWEQIDD